MSISFRSNRCYNGGNRHNFEARYDEKPTGVVVKRVSNADSVNEIEAIRKLTIYEEYLFDVCTWCGKKIKRDG